MSHSLHPSEASERHATAVEVEEVNPGGAIPRAFAAGARKPTIAHLLPWPSIGGVEIATTRVIQSTKGEFHHIAFCLANAEELREACRLAGAETFTYVPPEPSLRHFPRFYKQSKLVADELKRVGADLVHCSEMKAAYHNSLAALIAGVPLITHVRSRFSDLNLRDRLAFLPVKRFVFVSQDSRRQFGIKVSDAKSRVLYDAVTIPEPRADVEAVRSELGVPAGAPLIGMVARVNPQKDYDTLVDAAALVLAEEPRSWFAVVGDNSIVPTNRDHYAKVRARLQALGIEDRFTFTGFRSDVPVIVSALDIFVLSTHREGLPLAILEAMGMGKPVIATAVDGIPEVITPGVTGLLHAHRNSRELADAILSCVRDPDKARQMGLAAREQCRTLYNFETFAANVSRIYREMLPS